MIFLGSLLCVLWPVFDGIYRRNGWKLIEWGMFDECLYLWCGFAVLHIYALLDS